MGIYFYEIKADTIYDTIHHTVMHHHDKQNERFRIALWKNTFEEKVGLLAYKALHFNVTISDLPDFITDSQKMQINEELLHVSFKRSMA